MKRARVMDSRGQELTPCSEDKALDLVRHGRAALVGQDPMVIRLTYAVDLTSKGAPRAARGRMLLHICCAPCATYTLQRLKQQGWDVTGYWFNPNIHPFAEHEKRRETLVRYAEEIGLTMIWEPGYTMPQFLEAVEGHERYRERCLVCYRLRLAQTARVAGERGFEAITTTLLISPYQDLQALGCIGAGVAQEHGVAFHFENLRRGFAEHHRLAREHDLYQQRYCGCIFSERESQARRAAAR